MRQWTSFSEALSVACYNARNNIVPSISLLSSRDKEQRGHGSMEEWQNVTSELGNWFT